MAVSFGIHNVLPLMTIVYQCHYAAFGAHLKIAIVDWYYL